MSISDRKLMILKAIVDDYIMTGTPVGSRTIAKKSDINVSPATIRNEMADLEEEGYLEQPHTSAGRKPSDKAYRLYVDTLMRASSLTNEEISFLKQYMKNKFSDVSNVVETVAETLSELTNLTSVVLVPDAKNKELQRIQIVNLGEHNALVLFVFRDGDVKNFRVKMPKDIDDQYLDNISNWLTDFVKGKTLEVALTDMKELSMDDIDVYQQFGLNLLNMVLNNVESSGSKNIVLGGAKNIFNYPEYQDINEARNFLTLLDTKDALYKVLADNKDLELSIRIGKENDREELKNMSVVTATYRMDNKEIGTFGVIGPTRMDYAKVITILHYISESMDTIFKNEK